MNRQQYESTADGDGMSDMAPHGSLEVMGDINIEEGDKLQPYEKALVITFDSAEDIRQAIAAGKCSFGFRE